MSFKVIRPGFLSLIQDYGRYGQQAKGYTQGGPMDEHAYLWANRLLDNPFNASQLEITLGQLTLQATKPVNIALTGADLGATCNGRPLRPWQSHFINAGDELVFHAAKNGVRAYLAVTGGFQVEPTLGSSATVCREKIGGIDGKGNKLVAGDILEYQSDNNPHYHRQVPEFYIPDYSQPLTLRVIEGYQFDSFSPESVMRFYSSRYRISNQSDRMGYRLQGASIKSDLDGIISEGISYGAIQVPNDGQPIVLLKDRQTIGGYPKIGCVAALDAAKMSQRMPGTELAFTPANLQQIRDERLRFNRFFGIDY